MAGLVDFDGSKYANLLEVLSDSNSIWGRFDILNSKASSQETWQRVEALVDETGLAEGIFVGLRMMVSVGEHRPPLMVFDTNPDKLELSLDDQPTFIAGPLGLSEAKALGYLLETAFIAKDIFEGNIRVAGRSISVAFTSMAETIKGEKRFVPLGWVELYDYIARMVHYRNVKDDLPAWDMSEEEDLAYMVGDGVVLLAQAFRQDGYRVRESFQQELEQSYIGDPSLFVPFAGLDGHPKTREDWQMLGLGLYTGVRLFRQIEAAQGGSNNLLQLE